AFSPDGKQLAVANGREIRFLDVPTGRLLRLTPSPDAPRELMAFSPDGRYLAGTGGGTFWVINAETGLLVWKLTDTRLPNVGLLAFSSDGQTIALAAPWPKAPPIIELRHAATGKLESTLDTGPAGVTNFAFSPDLLRFVVVGHDGAVTYFNGRTN